MIQSFLDAGGLYLGTFLYGILAGLIPFVVPAEILLFGIAAKYTDWHVLAAAAVLTAAGQMVAKVMLYYGARGAIERAQGKRRAQIDRVQAKLEKWKDKPLWLLLLSSTVGLPPLYVVSLLAGALKIRIRAFLVVGMTGRVIRFAACVAFPAAIRGVMW